MNTNIGSHSSVFSSSQDICRWDSWFLLWKFGCYGWSIFYVKKKL